MPYKKIITAIKTHSPVLMGVVNVTPDSFFDGDIFSTPAQAVQHAVHIQEAGAMIIDIGGESSRPGAQPVELLTELRRVVPVIKGLVRSRTRTDNPRVVRTMISIDTYKPEVAAVALQLGADMVNDISGLRDPLMRQVVAKERCPVVVMHMFGTPGTMQKRPLYKNVVNDIIAYFKQRIILAKRAGITSEQIILDPGIGFGKTVNHNLEILKRLPKFKKAFPNHLLLIGASRKSFIGAITNTPQPDNRLPGTLAAHLLAVQHGADILRVHDVAEHKQALAIQKYLR